MPEKGGGRRRFPSLQGREAIQFQQTGRTEGARSGAQKKKVMQQLMGRRAFRRHRRGHSTRAARLFWRYLHQERRRPLTTQVGAEGVCSKQQTQQTQAEAEGIKPLAEGASKHSLSEHKRERASAGKRGGKPSKTSGERARGGGLYTARAPARRHRGRRTRPAQLVGDALGAADLGTMPQRS